MVEGTWGSWSHLRRVIGDLGAQGAGSGRLRSGPEAQGLVSRDGCAIHDDGGAALLDQRQSWIGSGGWRVGHRGLSQVFRFPDIASGGNNSQIFHSIINLAQS